ncbi:bifunctional folylpolyglutamate synthase/dihydrofolate synthase [Pediococcus cellicola]|uniref:tetrahydrofolate synthase n=1 Tax=Pediococcus cellicola TaxID=319652 RepID=A0A0R2IVZ6_9LACO|nr:Mur ligase family protein [Pediococcus cellicola]KRN65924.1 folylpolyglutamate synthase [Pediococcus cellicola]GEL16000.1 bifunctional folylpolyglutamate synthase/dihydrofolate synthase [Pediococcus cellicola]
MCEEQQTYQNLVTQMNQHVLVTENDRVEILRKVLVALNHPDHTYKIIHIAGTNGKGSTGAMLAAILQKNGYQVGHFSSPAMVDTREQIRLNGQLISYAQFLTAHQFIRERLPRAIKATDLSIFEWFTLIALVAFQQTHMDFVILEVGLGGKNDATNAISSPFLSVFTHIDYDHTQILGHTIRKIAMQKAGIIKPGTTIFVAPHQKRLTRQVLRLTAAQNQATIHFVRDIHLKVLNAAYESTSVRISGPLIAPQTIHLGLVGTFQLDNLATVLSIVTWLQHHQVHLVTTEVHTALAQLHVSGRMQLLRQKPSVFLDGAHNPDSAKQLAATLKRLYPQQKVIFLLGFLADKNYVEMLQIYLPMAKMIYVNTPRQHERALDKYELQRVVTHQFHFPKEHLVVAPSAKSGLQMALKQASRDDVIIITGSFYFIKQFEGEKNV